MALFSPDLPGTHVYEGITFPPIVPANNLDAMKTFKCRPDDVYCIAHPRSGTHWMFEILSLIVNGGDPSKIIRSHMTIGLEFNLASPTDLEAIKAATSGYKSMEGWESPRVMITHMLEQFFPPDVKEKKAKMVYLARNPKDVFYSALSFSRPILPPELQDIDNHVKFSLFSDKVPMGNWFQHVLGYAKHLKNDNFLFVKYEDLQKDLLGQVKRIANFLDRPLSDELAEKIAMLSTMKGMQKSYDQHEEDDPEGKTHTRAFGIKLLNKGKVGTWKEHITGDLNDLFDKVYKEKMEGSGLHFDFEV